MASPYYAPDASKAAEGKFQAPLHPPTAYTSPHLTNNIAPTHTGNGGYYQPPNSPPAWTPQQAYGSAQNTYPVQPSPAYNYPQQPIYVDHKANVKKSGSGDAAVAAGCCLGVFAALCCCGFPCCCFC